jgi:hypothetical protein
MTYPSRGVHMHALYLLLFSWFFCHVIFMFIPINMPVTTRSQARTSTRSVLEPLKSSTFPTSFEQSLESDLPNNTPVLLSTSLIAEPLTTTGHHLSSSTNLNTKHSEILQLDTMIICPIPNSGEHQSSSLEQLNLESTSTFEISNLSNFENLKSPLGNQLPSHNSSISNLSIMDDDDGADYLSQASARYAKTSTDIMDMNNLFAAIKEHLMEATTKLSSNFRQVVKLMMISRKRFVKKWMKCVNFSMNKRDYSRSINSKILLSLPVWIPVLVLGNYGTIISTSLAGVI